MTEPPLRVRKGQVTIEFLLIFTATIAVVSMLATAIIAQDDAAAGRLDEIARINKAEAAARAVEAMLNSGADVEFDFYDEGISYSVENGRFHVLYEGKIIEAGGVFADDDAEPV